MVPKFPFISNSFFDFDFVGESLALHDLQQWRVTAGDGGGRSDYVTFSPVKVDGDGSGVTDEAGRLS